MRDETLTQVKEMIRKTTGIIINAGFSKELSDVIGERVRVLHLEEADYPRYLESIHDEAVLLASRFTVQETSFYRYRQHFDRLKLQVLPELIRLKRQEHDTRLTIVSAGCATGEEPYTIAMIVHDLLKDREEWNVHILATDINAEALRLAKEGIFSDYRLRNIDPWYVYRYFDLTNVPGNASQHRLKGFIKSMVEFRQTNLIHEPFPLADLAGADIIFCENVIIYFCMESIQKLINNFHDILTPGGYLFLGHSETLNIVTHPFELTWWNDSFAYRKSGPSAVPEQPGEAAAAGALPAPEEPPEEAAVIPFTELIYLILQSFEAEAYETAAGLLRRTEESGAALNDVFHLIKGEYLYENRQYMPAANECRKAIGLNPKSAAAHLLLGAVYLDLGMLDNAQFEINTALYHEPESALGYYYLGRYYGLNGNPTERDYCLAYAKHLLEERGNVMTGKTFPFYRSRREDIIASIKNAPAQPDVPGRAATAGWKQGGSSWKAKSESTNS
jgi:chemotaxis protein methyltransferase CheR